MREKRQKRNDIVARVDDAFKNNSYAEYSVNKTVEGKYKMQRILMVLAYIGVFFAVIAIVAVISGIFPSLGMFGVVLFALAPLAMWVMIHFTWGLVSIEYKYVIDHSEFSLYTVYGGKNEKLMFKCKMKEFELIAPYNDEYKGQLRAFGATNTIEAVPTMNTYDIYFALHKDENNVRTALFFQVTNYTLKAFKYYNKEALVVTETVR